ncbi:glucose-6-phosphate isomerase [Alkalispirillum mobile]|uniref:Glucose-6-phosphate isomerase n=1 Tax=Alkalispirillum mobile TaxID=85925 RepID=A0A498C5S5_9GAMM|nr:glucose-6-phosphate isomerase [Alkalispirillum mobile]RLK48380.1 glucose-6-phosphate isomerase [Alkalispirillum mobile]
MSSQAQHWPAKAALKRAAQAIPALSTLLTNDPGRHAKYQRASGGLLLDFSRQRINDDVLSLLTQCAVERCVPAQREALVTGAPVNCSEQRPALHTALRWPVDKAPLSGTESACRFAHQQQARMAQLVTALQHGEWLGATGKPITDIIHIGVGGSDLGPRLVSEALQGFATPQANPIKAHFVSTIDGTQLGPLTAQLDPASTLVVIASKSFATADTLANARSALGWISTQLNIPEREIIAAQVVGVSARPDRMIECGIPTAHQLLLGDCVGGRFSVWSPISLVVAAQLGMPVFQRLLQGAHQMDCHFLNAPLADNLPVLAGLLAVWNAQYLGIPTHAALPYDGRLACLPAYLQQLEMESNGKTQDAHKTPLDHATCPIVWGDVGSNGQHAFYQLLHQGSHTVSADLMVAVAPQRGDTDSLTPQTQEQHQLTQAHCLAQARLLTLGDAAVGSSDASKVPGYRGNQPCNLLVLDALTPEILGQLLALYEHKVFVKAALWGLNPFDQPGVEFGKTLATEYFQALAPGGNTPPGLDECTAGTLETLRSPNLHNSSPRW